ncbi:hypothetical protein NtRootA1_15510 [Arthrobacter sp. NtRootA1]|nr:hypothetical protein NtRootA1_15510 [Arthrobacter sp. NtRootA1]
MCSFCKVREFREPLQACLARKDFMHDGGTACRSTFPVQGQSLANRLWTLSQETAAL